MKRALIRVLDFVMSPFVAASLPMLLTLARLREKTPLSRGLLDKAGISLVRHHYYTPVIVPGSLKRPLSEPRDLPGFEFNEEAQLALLETFRYGDELSVFEQKKNGLNYYYEANNYGPGDSEILYSVIRHFQPRLMIEIGSGQSTLMAKAALDRNRQAGHPCRHVCIEPFENTWLDQIGVEVVREKVEDLDLSLFEALGANDILFIDSSHVIRPQGDVLHEYLSILPRLKPGVLIHMHDIFSPADYPAEWVWDWRLMWNEQYLLEAFLTHNSQFEVLLSLNWMYHRHRAEFVAAAPHSAADSVNPGSFWIRRK